MNSESLEISNDGTVLYILGSSTGDSFPFLGHQTDNNGGRDVFIASISAADGNLLCGSYFGGENDDFQGEVVALSDGLIAISGSTQSETDIATQGAYQSEYGGGVTDNFLAVFDDNGSLNWSTYLGGQDSDGGVSKNIFARNGTIYLSSKSRSMHEIGIGNQQIEFQAGDFDNVDYLAAFDVEGNLNWCSALNPNYSCTSNFDFIIHNDGTIYSVGIYENMFGQSETEECISVISPDAQQPEYGGGDEDIGIFIYDTNVLSTSVQYVGQLELYPNPATDLVNIEAPNLLSASMELAVTDISRRQVDRIAQFRSGNSHSTTHLSEGVYILTGRFGERVFREKLVVQR